MPKTLPLALIVEKNKLNTDDPWLVFLDVVLPDESTLQIVNNTENVVWNSTTYVGLPFQLGVNKYSQGSEIPSIELKVSNVARSIQAQIDGLHGLIGSTVTLHIVNTGHLTEDFSELDVTFSVIATSVDSEWVTFSLGAPNPIRQRFPLYYFLSNSCNWLPHFKGHECAYGKIGSPSEGGTDTSCKGTLEDCEAKNNSQRFGGFKGLNPNGFRIA